MCFHPGAQSHTFLPDVSRNVPRQVVVHEVHDLNPARFHCFQVPKRSSRVLVHAVRVLHEHGEQVADS